jgi:hypothetical protein
MADRIGYAMLFLTLVAVVVAVGILVGMLVAGRIDRLTTPRPASRDDGDPVVMPPPVPEDEQA